MLIYFCLKALSTSKAFKRRFDDVMSPGKVRKSYYKVRVKWKLMRLEYFIISMGLNNLPKGMSDNKNVVAVCDITENANLSMVMRAYSDGKYAQ